MKKIVIACLFGIAQMALSQSAPSLRERFDAEVLTIAETVEAGKLGPSEGAREMLMAARAYFPKDTLTHAYYESALSYAERFERKEITQAQALELLQMRTARFNDALTARTQEQMQRNRVMDKFRKRGFEFLVATDVAARGLDIEDLPQVVNFDLPLQAEDYVHRIGRTGRAGQTGEAISLVCADEAPLLGAIEQLIKQPLSRDEEPGFEPQHKVPATGGVAKPVKAPKKPKTGGRAAPANWVGFDDAPARPAGAARGRPGGGGKNRPPARKPR